jgi:uncharacterized protein (TIGR04222 family)
MSVFNLPGPSFLGLFFFFALVLMFVNLLVLHRSQTNSSSDHARVFFNAPYLLAYLAQGHNHCLAVCAFNLIDRGLLRSVTRQQIAATAGSSNKATHPLEIALLRYASSGPVDLFKATHNSDVKAALTEINNNLSSLGLLNQQRFFTPAKLICVFLLLSVGLTKIVIALGHGHHNIGLLIVLMVIFSLVYLVTVAPRLTGSGKQTLSTLRNLLAQLHARAADLQPGGFTPEATLAAALFGLAILPAHAFPYATAIVPPRATSSGDSGSSGSDSSCGSSCSSSCSSGCGGCGS